MVRLSMGQLTDVGVVLAVTDPVTQQLGTLFPVLWLQHQFSQSLDLREPFLVAQQIGNAETHLSGLARAEHFASTAQLQVFLGDLETILRAANDIEASSNLFGKLILYQQDTKAFTCTASYASAQLVYLGKAETFRIFQNHDVCIGHIDADLYYRRRHQDMNITFFKGGNNGLLVARLHTPVHQAHRQLR